MVHSGVMRVPRSLEALPTPVRAALGLAVTVADEAKRLPERAIDLPMFAVHRAMQLSLHAQQRYAELTARGDQVLAARQVTDEAPSWATFDDPVEPTPSTKVPNAPRHGAPSAFDAVVEEPDTADHPSSADHLGTADGPDAYGVTPDVTDPDAWAPDPNGPDSNPPRPVD